MTTALSVVLPVYNGERHLTEALDSVLHQTHEAFELVVVDDGSTDATPAMLAEYARRDDRIRVVTTENGGVIAALRRGLEEARYDLVARMDADDVSVPERFALQLPEIEAGADLVGSALLEIGGSEDDVVGRRTPPTDPGMIARSARLHDPINHPTVVYRRSAVAAAGGYEHVPLLEDYWLFARMIHRGARVVNRPEPLVLYRVGEGAYRRRGGTALLRAELRLQVLFVRSGFTTPAQFVRNVVIRCSYRLVPSWVRKPVYRLLVATRGARLDSAAARSVPRR